MPRYLISFEKGAVDHILEEEIRGDPGPTHCPGS
jgi:hypothetical protein